MIALTIFLHLLCVIGAFGWHDFGGPRHAPEVIVKKRKACPAGASPSPTWSHTGPKATLQPACHYDHQLHDLQHLQPSLVGNMYYSESGVITPTMNSILLHMNANFFHPTVILEHSGYIDSVSWSGNTMTIDFNSPAGYAHAQNCWGDQPTFVLATTAANGGPHPEQRGYFIVKHLIFEDPSLQVIAAGIEVDLPDAIDDIHLTWGDHAPAAPNDGPAPSASFSSMIGTSFTPSPSPSAMRPPPPMSVSTEWRTTTVISTTMMRSVSTAYVTETTVVPSTTVMWSTTLQVVTTTLQASTITTSYPVTQVTSFYTTVLSTTTISGEPVTVTSSYPVTEVSSVYTTSVYTMTIQGQASVITTSYPVTETAYTTALVTTVISGQPVTVTTAYPVTEIQSVYVTSVYTTTAAGQVIPVTTTVPVYTISVIVSTASAQPVTFTQSYPVTQTQFMTTTQPTVVISTTSYPVVYTVTQSTSYPVTVTYTPSASSTSSSSTTSYSSISACGPPPSGTISGQPAASCGSNFDSSVDSSLGYYNFNGSGGSAAVSSFAPGASGLSPSDFSGGGGTKRDLHQWDRRWGWSSFKSAVSSVVSKAVTTVAKVAVAVATHYVNAVVTIAKVAVAIVTDDYNPSVSLSIPINVGPKPAVLEDSPWGKAYKIFECGAECGLSSPSAALALKNLVDQGGLLPTFVNGIEEVPQPGVTLFCVGCGINGTLSASGSAHFSLRHGVDKAQVGVSGGIDAGFGLGLEAYAIYNKDLAHFRIISVGLPGFYIPKIVTVGPQVSLDVKAGIKITAQGQVMAGIHFSMPNFVQTIDFIHPSQSKSSGWTPHVSHVFNAAGSLSAAVSLGLPLGVTVGIDILDGKYALEAGLVDTPAVVLNAEYSASYTNNNGAVSAQSGNDDCNGIDWYVDLENKVELVVPQNTWLLGQWHGPTLASGCIGSRPTPASDSSSPSSPVVTSLSSRSSTTSTSSSTSTSKIVPLTTCNPCAPIMQNGGFDNPTIDPWSVNVPSQCTYQLATPGINGTANYVKVYCPNSYGVTLTQNVSLIAGATYNISGWYQFATTNQMQNCYINTFVNGAYVLSWSPYFGTISYATWLYGSNTFVAPSCLATLMTNLVCVGGNSGTMYFDNVSIYLKSMPATTTGIAMCTTTSSTTTTTSSTRTSTSLAASQTAGFGSCPSGDGKYYAASDGRIYKMHCNLDYYGYDLVTAQVTTDLKACADRCATVSGCKAVVFVPSRPTANCYFKSGPYGATVQTFECDAAEVVTTITKRDLELQDLEDRAPGIHERQGTTSSTSRSSTITSTSTSSSSRTTSTAYSTLVVSSNSTSANTTGSSFDAAAAANEASFVVVQVPPSNNTNGTDANFDLPSLADTLQNATDIVDGLATDPSNTTSNTASGAEFITLYDTTSSVMLIASSDDNFYLTAYTPPTSSAPVPGSAFASFQNVIISDSQNRFLIFYPSQIAAFNVSRFRLADNTTVIPRSAQMITLAPVQVPTAAGTQVVYAGLDTLGNWFSLVWCNMRGGSAKVFMAGDSDVAIDRLMSNSLDWTVAGDVVGTCSPLALTSQGAVGINRNGTM